MPNGKILSVTACVLVLAAAAADYGLGQVDVAKPHRLPVESFPATIGVWQGGPIQEVDPEVQKKLATAKIVEREYVNPGGAGRGPDAAHGDGRRGHAQPEGVFSLAGLETERCAARFGGRAAGDGDERRV